MTIKTSRYSCILLQFVTHFPTQRWHNSAIPRISGQGLPIMRTLRGQPRAEEDDRFRVRVAEEEGELALLAQFMRHDSVASLANAIAERTGVRSGDLIAAAGLDPRRADR
jgi:hypothetical protein